MRIKGIGTGQKGRELMNGNFPFSQILKSGETQDDIYGQETRASIREGSTFSPYSQKCKVLNNFLPKSLKQGEGNTNAFPERLVIK